MKETAPRCPVHVGTEMVLANAAAPIFARHSRMGRIEARAAKRMIYRCAVPDCPAVAKVPDGPEQELCRVCKERLADSGYGRIYDYRCRECVLTAGIKASQSRRARSAAVAAAALALFILIAIGQARAQADILIPRLDLPSTLAVSGETSSFVASSEVEKPEPQSNFTARAPLAGSLALYENTPHRRKLFLPIRALHASGQELRDTFKDLGTCRDVQFCVAGWMAASAYAADMISTSRAFSQCPRCVENGLVLHGTRDAAKLSLAYGGLLIADLLLSHAWKTHVKNRWLRKLWIIVPMIPAEQHSQGAWDNEHTYRNPL